MRLLNNSKKKRIKATKCIAIALQNQSKNEIYSHYNKSAFTTNWFDYENNYNPDYNMIVIDKTRGLITFDGETWQDIEEDSL